MDQIKVPLTWSYVVTSYSKRLLTSRDPLHRKTVVWSVVRERLHICMYCIE